jgi:hypothetical protein
VSESGRDTQGVRLMRFKQDGDEVTAVTWIWQRWHYKLK